MQEKTYYSVRTGKNSNMPGIDLRKTCELFVKFYEQFANGGYFNEAFGSFCVDAGDIAGKVTDVEFEILLKVRKESLWPIYKCADKYTEDDLFDIIEFLHEHVSKPLTGWPHNYGNCGMHWETFDKVEGQKEYRQKINELLALYVEPFILNPIGEILHKPQKGFEKIFAAKLPTDNDSITGRVDAAVSQFQRHGSSIDDRRSAVRNLVDVLEYLREPLKNILNRKDEADLFNIANNFGIRHHNDQQKTNYDTALWLSWMFYFYLSTIHLMLRKLEHEGQTTDKIQIS